MKKGKVKTQLRKLATREAMEKRRGCKPLDPFTLMMLSPKARNSVSTEYDNYEDEEEYNYGEQ